MTAPGTPVRLPGRALGLAATGAVLVGMELRLFAYLHRSPLYVDEAMLALNVARRSFVGLLHSLDYDQSGPVLYLWILKLASLVGGMGELALRFPPLLAGVALLCCYRPLARALAGDEAGLLALVLLAMSVSLVNYSADLKQYGSDALVTAVLCLLALRVRRAPESRAAWLWLTAVGTIALGVSMPAVFVLPAVIAALAADRRVRSTPGAIRRSLVASLVWLAAFGLLYVTVYRAAMANAYLHRFWEGSLLTPGAPDLRLRAARAMVGLMVQTPFRAGGVGQKVLVLGLLGGMFSIWRRKGLPEALLVGVPFLMALLASMLGKYPMYDRFLLFLAPLSLIALSALVFEGVRRLGSRVTGVAALVLPALCLAAYLPRVTREADRHMVREEGRELVGLIQREAGTAPVYVMASGLPAWVWYTTDWRHPDETRLAWFAGIARADGPSAHNGPSRGHAVPEPEGRDLIDRHNGLTALIGVRTGIQFTTDLGPRDTEPDSGWAVHEVRRLAAAAAPYGWVFGAHAEDREIDRLRAALREAGAVTVSMMTEGRAIALRVRFPGVRRTEP
jgi:hypothetical protein